MSNTSGILGGSNNLQRAEPDGKDKFNPFNKAHHHKNFKLFMIIQAYKFQRVPISVLVGM